MRARALSVVVAQPHRVGSDDPLDPLNGSALGRFCLRRWPSTTHRDFREARCEAGNRFAQDIDNDRVASGFTPRLYGRSNGDSGALTEDQLRARRELCALNRSAAEAEIRTVHGRAVEVMTRLCWEDIDAGPYDEDLIFHCLYRFAKHYGIEKREYHATGT
jgi:hypothetical protein